MHNNKCVVCELRIVDKDLLLGWDACFARRVVHSALTRGTL